jgi:hypothetical protein
VINDGCFVTQSRVSALVHLFENMFFSSLLVFAPFESASSLLKRYATTLVVGVVSSSFPELDSPSFVVRSARFRRIVVAVAANVVNHANLPSRQDLLPWNKNLLTSYQSVLYVDIIFDIHFQYRQVLSRSTNFRLSKANDMSLCYLYIC